MPTGTLQEESNGSGRVTAVPLWRRDSSQCFSDSKAKPRLSFPLGSSHCKSNKGILSPAQLAVKPLSAKTSGMGLCSQVLQYPKNTAHLLGVLVCAFCAVPLPSWSTRNGVEVTLRGVCVVSAGHGEEEKKQAWHLIFLLVSSFFSIVSIPLHEGKEELPSTAWAQLGCKA